jgi:hypothetical protein
MPFPCHYNQGSDRRRGDDLSPGRRGAVRGLGLRLRRMEDGMCLHRHVLLMRSRRRPSA